VSRASVLDKLSIKLSVGESPESSWELSANCSGTYVDGRVVDDFSLLLQIDPIQATCCSQTLSSAAFWTWSS
ncbi:hypothetical protein Tco_0219052, partial [Tanacetum coccineum]